MDDRHQLLGRRLVQLGLVLFLAGLLTGFVIPVLAIPRMGLTSHLEGLLNGMFLVLIGLIWPRLLLPGWALTVTFWMAVYAGVMNWATTLLAAIWGAGASMMPIAAGTQMGTGTQEAVIAVMLMSLSMAAVLTLLLLIWGLRGKRGVSSVTS